MVSRSLNEKRAVSRASTWPTINSRLLTTQLVTVHIPKLGWVNLAENVRFQGKITGARVTKVADWWFISIPVEMPDEPQQKRQARCGVDIGVSRLATLSTGEHIENQAVLSKELKRLRKANKHLHRCVKGSKNREKAQRKVARLHYQIACKREDVLQKLTTRLANSFGFIGLEDLHVRGLIQNRHIARALSDAALGRFRVLLTGKVEQRDGQIVAVGRFFPSTKQCHCCGWKWDGMQLADRVFLCQNLECPYHLFSYDRDHNAPQNLLREALRLVGLIDQVVSDTGSDWTLNSTVDAG